MMKTSIKLSDIRFFAYHGVLEQERKAGNNYVVNISMDADLSLACKSDNVEDTINYAEVYNIVEKEMKQPSNLIEHVAMRILKSIKSSFPQILNIEVRLAKNNPPVRGEIKCAEVIISE
ncbi:MAG TPA: dihydroneopterin aldolase [Dysgonamonadaceae bacterium]|nr:dihydroneopterin aldolase [Dysgonamonadaceae bacterium]